MKIAFFIMLLAVGMASSEQESSGEIVELGNVFSFVCSSAIMLYFYAPLHTMAWCILNSDQGGWACA